MIRLENVSFSYNQETPVLKNLHISFDKQATAIIGQNGAGKTTLAKLLKGLLKPDRGAIYVKDQNLSETTAAGLAGVVGLVFQNPNDQIFKKSVLEEVMFGPLNIKMSRDAAREHSLRALNLVGLEDKLDENPHDLGLSEKKLLCIASIVAMDTDVIILDEPTIAQDWRGKDKIKEIIGILKSEHKLVMTIIHDMDFVAENFERTIVLNEGELLMDGDTRKVFACRELLQKARVEPPYVAQLAFGLGWRSACLTDDEFVGQYREMGKDDGIQI